MAKKQRVHYAAATAIATEIAALSTERSAQIIEILPAYHERERKYVPVVPPDIAAQGDKAIADYKKQKLMAIYDFVCRNTDQFVTADHPDLAPHLPPGLEEEFSTPAERTAPRQRIYFADAKLEVWDRDLEIRQQVSPGGEVKQTIKRGARASDKNPTLARIERPAKLAWRGVNLEAVADKGERRWLKQHFDEAALKPLFRMVSQRLRTSYHPDGDQGVLIEIACDVVLVGETVFGKTWRDPKLEIEIKRPKNLKPAECEAILDREEKRLLAMFALARQMDSNAAVGYGHLKADLESKEGQRIFARMKPDQDWWSPAQRPQWGLT